MVFGITEHATKFRLFFPLKHKYFGYFFFFTIVYGIKGICHSDLIKLGAFLKVLGLITEIFSH